MKNAEGWLPKGSRKALKRQPEGVKSVKAVRYSTGLAP